RITFGLGHDTGTVTFGLFGQARGGTTSARHHVVGIGFGFVLGAVALLAGLENVVERGLHLLGRTYPTLLQVHTGNLDAHVVAVQDGLHQIAHARRDLVTLFGQHRVHFHLAH